MTLFVSLRRKTWTDLGGNRKNQEASEQTRGEVPGAAEESEQAGRGAGAAPQGHAQCSPAHGAPLAYKGGGEGRARTGSLARGDGHRAGPAPGTPAPPALPVWMRLCRSSWLGLANAFSHVSHLNTLGFCELREGPA